MRVTQANGPVFGELASEATAEKFPKITLRVRLYHGLKRIDVRCELDKEETTGQGSRLYRVPVRARGGSAEGCGWNTRMPSPSRSKTSTAPRAATGMPCSAGSRPRTARQPWCSRRWTRPLVTLGGMTASTWPRQLSLKRAHVFAYVMNNYWYTNYKASQGGRQVFRFSLTSSRGGFSKRDAVARGWEMFCAARGASGGGPLKPVLSAPAKQPGRRRAGGPAADGVQAGGGRAMDSSSASAISPAPAAS